MQIKIILSEKSIEIRLKKGVKILDSVTLTDKNNLSQSLLINIERLLKKNNLSKNQLKRISVDNKLPDSYTSGRIAKSLEKSFNFAVKPK